MSKRDRERLLSPAGLLTSHISAADRATPGQSQKVRTQPKSLMGVAGTPVLEPSFASLQDVLKELVGLEVEKLGLEPGTVTWEAGCPIWHAHSC